MYVKLGFMYTFRGSCTQNWVLCTYSRSQGHKVVVSCISQLAEGADQLVARVALSEGAQLVAPIPFSFEEYETDFKSENSKSQLRDLASQAEKVFTVPRRKQERESGYTEANIYLVRHCDILIALWDGKESEPLAGTDQAVTFKLNGVSRLDDPSQRDFDDPETGPVYHIVTPRRSTEQVPKDPYSLTVRYGTDGENEPEKLKQRLKNLDSYNRDVKNLRHQGKGLLPKLTQFQWPESVQRINQAYRVADSLAQDYQQRRQQSLRVSIGCVLLAIISFETFADIVPNPALGTLYPVLLIGALIVYLYDKRQDYLRKHLDYRALAEGLRVQLYWNMVEVPHNVGHEYLRQHRSELDWIRSSLRTLAMVASLSDDETRTSEFDRFQFVADAWVSGQRDYFAKNVQRVSKWLWRLERRISYAFVFGLLTAIVICIAQWTLTDWVNAWRDRLIWLLVVVPAVAAVAGTYADKLASYEQTRRYDCMVGLYDRAHRRLEEYLRLNDFESARELLFDLGKEALEENGEWVIIRRDRELDPPEAG